MRNPPLPRLLMIEGQAMSVFPNSLAFPSKCYFTFSKHFENKKESQNIFLHICTYIKYLFSSGGTLYFNTNNILFRLLLY